MQTVFGAGALIGSATQDAYGNAIATPTPVQFGVLQNVSLDISFDVKELYGSNQFPIAVGRGKGKISGKAAFAQINGLMLNNLLFGQTIAGGTLAVDGPITTTLSSTSYTATPPGSGTWVADLGVAYATNGQPFTRVVSGPTSGQYAVANGAYTFASADNGQGIIITYQYSSTFPSARRVTVANVAMGYAPTFRMDFYNNYNNKPITLTAGACIATKLSMATKLDDFMLPDFEFSVFADPSNNLLTIGTAE